MLVSHPGILILAMRAGEPLPLFHYAFVLNKTRNLMFFSECTIATSNITASMYIVYSYTRAWNIYDATSCNGLINIAGDNFRYSQDHTFCYAAIN